MNANSLFALTTEAAQIEDMLWESGGEITPELEERMNDNDVALKAKTDSYGALIHKFGSTEDMIDAEIKRLTALKKVAQNAETKLKDRVKHSMEQNGMTKLDGAFTKFSLRKSEKTITDDEKLVTSKTPMFPADWKDQFGMSFYEHQQSLKISTFDGYAVYAIKNKAKGRQALTALPGEVE